MKELDSKVIENPIWGIANNDAEESDEYEDCKKLLHGSGLHTRGDADNPIYRRYRRKVIIPLRVELDITVQDAQVRTGGTAITAAGLANVVNRGLLL
ncbi:hypothetical protein [Aeromonas hydrophila]|uniref:hypothetical protein n=1 Tax=Aeromonas hydrophila TaxID=644 RepID=UPI0036D7A7FC